jgi:hypothetical protein
VQTFLICVEQQLTQVTCNLFRCFFSVVASPTAKLAPKVHQYMLDILCAIVDESDTLSDELFDIIFEALLEPHKSEAPAAAQLARGVIKLTATHIEDCVNTVGCRAGPFALIFPAQTNGVLVCFLVLPPSTGRGRQLGEQPGRARLRAYL